MNARKPWRGERGSRVKTKAVLFDLDGTLVDTIPLIVKTYKTVFEKMKIPWGDDDVVKWIGRPLKDIGIHFAGAGEPDFFELYQHHYHLLHDEMTWLFPGTGEILAALKNCGLKLGIVTSKGRPVTERTVAHTGLDRLMDVIVTAHDVEKHKPEPEPLLSALSILGTQAGRSVFVGDSKYDIITGQRAGARAIGVTWGLGGKEELAGLKPTALLEQWGDLLKYL